MKNLSKTLVFYYKNIIHNLIYLISRFLYLFIKPSKKIWVFGSWFGQKYSDNSRYLFEYVNKFHPEIKSIWLCKNNEIVNLIRSKGYKAYYAFSFLGYFYSFKAHVAIICTSFEDLNEYMPQKFIVNLWHGCPLKKIGYDDKINLKTRDLIDKIIWRYKRELKDIDMAIASSKIEAKNLATAFGIKPEKVKITGLPRNDSFFVKLKKFPTYNIIYMPTHRNEGEIDIECLFMEYLDLINSSLIKIDSQLFIKLHFYHRNNSLIDKIKLYSNVHLIEEDDVDQDIYHIIPQFDLLITDYSSILFDYLICEKPIIFAAFDYNNYIINDREFYYEYKSFVPGPVCDNWHNVILWIEKFKNNPNLFYRERVGIKKMFHAHIYGKYSENVFNCILSELKISDKNLLRNKI